MISATGTLYMSKTKALTTTAADGTFALTLLLFDRQGPQQVEPWRITWSGSDAQAFWQEHGDAIQPGTVLEVSLQRIRTFSQGRFSGAESHAQVAFLSLASLKQQIGAEPSCSLPV